MDQNKIVVIMLGHKALAGKDTFYNFSKGYKYTRVAFADKLKDMVSDLYGFSYSQMYGEEKDIIDMRYKNLIDAPLVSSVVPGRAGPLINPNPRYTEYLSPRRILQLYGQQQRSIFPDVWPSYIFNRRIPELMKEGHRKFIITDFRFKNEYQVAKNWASQDPDNRIMLAVKINRGVTIKVGSEDISERDLLDFNLWDEELNNFSTLEAYKEITQKYLDYIEKEILGHSLII